jgi:hypothetical protein
VDKILSGHAESTNQIEELTTNVEVKTMALVAGIMENTVEVSLIRHDIDKF